MKIISVKSLGKFWFFATGKRIFRFMVTFGWLSKPGHIIDSKILSLTPKTQVLIWIIWKFVKSSVFTCEVVEWRSFFKNCNFLLKTRKIMKIMDSKLSMIIMILLVLSRKLYLLENEYHSTISQVERLLFTNFQMI